MRSCEVAGSCSLHPRPHAPPSDADGPIGRFGDPRRRFAPDDVGTPGRVRCLGHRRDRTRKPGCGVAYGADPLVRPAYRRVVDQTGTTPWWRRDNGQTSSLGGGSRHGEAAGERLSTLGCRTPYRYGLEAGLHVMLTHLGSSPQVLMAVHGLPQANSTLPSVDRLWRGGVGSFPLVVPRG
jgi:hypothetical protein